MDDSGVALFWETSTWTTLGFSARRMKHAFQLTGIPCQQAFLIALPCLSALLDHSAVHLRLSLHDSGGALLETLAELLTITAKELCVPIAIGLVGIFTGIRRNSELFGYKYTLSLISETCTTLCILYICAMVCHRPVKSWIIPHMGYIWKWSSINQSINQSINGSMNQWIYKSINQSINQSINSRF